MQCLMYKGKGWKRTKCWKRLETGKWRNGKSEMIMKKIGKNNKNVNKEEKERLILVKWWWMRMTIKRDCKSEEWIRMKTRM